MGVSATGYETTCSYSADGSIVITGVSGGTGTYGYEVMLFYVTKFEI